MAKANKKAGMFFTDTKNYIKLVVLFLLGVLLVISVVALILAYRSNKYRAEHNNVVATNPEAIKSAEDTIDSLLVQNSLHIVKEFNDKQKYLELKIDSDIWKKLPTREKRQFLKNLTNARATLGLIPDVKVLDYKTGIEFASSERGRIALAGHDD